MREDVTALEKTDQHASRILKNLGLRWKDLEGKSVLDVGAGPADLARAATRRGIWIVCADQRTDMYLKEAPFSESRVPFIRADATALPFADETYDLVLSHAAIPDIGGAHENYHTSLMEATRVARRGGEFRFGAFGTLQVGEPIINPRIQEVRPVYTRFVDSFTSHYPQFKPLQTGDGDEPSFAYVYKKN